MPTTNKDICNEALDRLSVPIITTFGSDGTPQDNFMYRNYAQIWKEVMREAGVNTTRRRAELQYSSMTLTLSAVAVGTGVTATAGSAFFRAADVGSVLNELTTGGTGESEIAAFTSSTVVTVSNTIAWSALVTAANSWRMEPVGAEYTYTYEVPSGFVKAIRLDDSSYPYIIEGNRILTDYTDAVLTFDYYESDPDQWEPAIWQAIVAKLAMEAAWPLTHDSTVVKIMAAQYESKLGSAKGAAKSEVHPQVRIARSVLVDVR